MLAGCWICPGMSAHLVWRRACTKLPSRITCSRRRALDNAAGTAGGVQESACCWVCSTTNLLALKGFRKP